MTTDKRSEIAETANPDENAFPVTAAIRKLGATEDIRAYVYRTLKKKKKEFAYDL